MQFDCTYPNDTEGIMDLISIGTQIVLFVTGRGSVIGSPIAPPNKVTGNSASYRAMAEDTDYDVGMVRLLATEWGQHGVRVNAIAPGWIASNMLDQALSGDSARKAKILSRIPAGKFGEPDDIGWAAVYLASSAAKYVNGVVLPVDGGAAESF